MSSMAAWICAWSGTSTDMCRSVRRTDPMSMLTAEVTLSVPRTSSVEPPPRSMTRNGPLSAERPTVAPRNDRWASSSPVMTSGTTPRMPKIPAENSSRFFTSRLAEVATNLSFSGEYSAATSANSRAAANVRSSASGANSPVASTPWPRRTIRVSRRSSVIWPCSSTSAMSRRRELVPQSKAATRMSSPIRLPRSRRPLRLPGWERRS